MLLRNQKPNYVYSEAVEKWQRDLVAAGYNLQIDGYFGDETERETRRFQQDMEISVDGIVGPETLGAMEVKKGTIDGIYKRGSRGTAVRWIQQQYRDRGYELAVDGIFGPETERITRQFQIAMEIQIDGIVGPETIGKLEESYEPIGGKKIKVYIDNGHVPGNVNGGSQGYTEWEGNLKSARYLADILTKTNKFDVLITYDWNRYAGLTARGQRASRWGAKLFFSIHSNAGGGAGTECYYSVDLPDDKKYAESITNRVSQGFDIPNRGAKVKRSTVYPGEDWMTVVDTAQDEGVDHVLLVESMFHDNDKEERLLLQDDTHRKLAEIYASVIYELFEIK